MAKQVINLGTMADNKSGDPLRTAFTKINQNFDELYAYLNSDNTNVSGLIDSVSALQQQVSNVETSLANRFGRVTIVNNDIIGASPDAAGISIPIEFGVNGPDQGINGNGIAVDPNIPNLGFVTEGWSVTFADQSTAPVLTAYHWTADGDFWVIQFPDNITKDGASTWPLILTSPDYVAGSPKQLILTSGDTSPGSAVVLNEDSVDINFAGFGNKFKFKPDGDLVDGDGNSLLNQTNTATILTTAALTGGIALNAYTGYPNYGIGGHNACFVGNTWAGNGNYSSLQVGDIVSNGQGWTATITQLGLYGDGWITLDQDWLNDPQATYYFSGAAVRTAIDLTKTVQKLTDGDYVLHDGQEGQMIYFVQAPNNSGNAINLYVDNARINVNQYQNIYFNVFAGSSTNLVTFIFTDGCWQAFGGIWD